MVQNNKGHQEFNYYRTHVDIKILSGRKMHAPFCHGTHHR